MGLKDLIIWSIIGIQGLSLIFDGQARNNFFEAISYIHNYSDKSTQDLAQILRIVIGLLLASAFFGIKRGILFKAIPSFSFILYFVFTNNSILLSKFDVHKIQSMILELIVFLFAIDSLINQALQSDKQKNKLRSKSKQVIQKNLNENIQKLQKQKQGQKQEKKQKQQQKNIKKESQKNKNSKKYN